MVVLNNGRIFYAKTYESSIAVIIMADGDMLFAGMLTQISLVFLLVFTFKRYVLTI